MSIRVNFKSNDENFTAKGKQFRYRQEYGTPELWDEIASYCTRRTLQNLSLVHRCTTHPAQRHLFRNPAFIVPFTYIEKFSTIEEAQALLQRNLERFNMLSSSHLTKYVRGWVWHGMIHDYPEDPIDRGEAYSAAMLASTQAISRLVASLSQYPLLEYLVLAELVVDNSTLLAISSMKNLSSLRLHSVDFECPPVLVNPLPLRHFLLENYKRDALSGCIFSPLHLETLTLTYDPTKPALLSSLLSDLLTHKPHTNLVELAFQIVDNVSPEGMSLFVDLVKRSPLLQTIRFTIEAWYTRTFLSFEQAIEEIELDTDACPLLNNLACSPTFATLFGRGKPITDLYLQNLESRSLSTVTAALEAMNGAILTDLEFERTITEDAQKILPLIHRLLPNLQVLCIPIYDIQRQRTSPRASYFDDDTRIKDPDDLEHEREQFEACYDQPDQEVLFDEGYPRFLHDIALGLLPLPETLVTLEVPQIRLFKGLEFTKDHELELIELFAKNAAFKNLRTLKIGMNNVYNLHWQRDSCEGCWTKKRYYLQQDGKNMVGTMSLSPYESARVFLDAVEV
ncbi:hypothetical protein CPC08DRAFT_821606 [Agrocybe pediades]|nr:hypothetical protein CPC08DRAFT_821606 [Agrocybe pediades]